MDYKELMCGDWVNYKSPSSGKLQPIKINNIYGAEFNCEVEDWNIISGKSISDTEPIKLTEGILVKNGFASSEGYAYLNLDENNFLEFCYYNHRLSKIYMGIEIDDWNKRVKIRDVVFVSNCNYVHEFQHALRLCGVEKSIIL